MTALVVEKCFVCLQCGGVFKRRNYKSSFDSAKKYKKYRYCSRKCMAEFHKGTPVHDWERIAQELEKCRGAAYDPALQPHPKRCETCIDKKCDWSPVSPDNWNVKDSEGWVLTSQKGCASHSSTPAPEPAVNLNSELMQIIAEERLQAAKAGRERVLDELCLACKALNQHTELWCEKCLVESLRSGGK